MDGVGSGPRNDIVLLPYLQARNEPDASAALERLICEGIQPVIREVIYGKLRIGHSPSSDLTDDEAADLAGEVMLKLIRRLRELRYNLTEPAIENFRGYIAVTAYHACDGYLRKKYPHRHSLKNQLRYVLTHHEGFALWESGGGVWLCGFARWRDGQRAVGQSKLREFVERPGLSDRFAKQAGHLRVHGRAGRTRQLGLGGSRTMARQGSSATIKFHRGRPSCRCCARRDK